MKGAESELGWRNRKRPKGDTPEKEGDYSSPLWHLGWDISSTPDLSFPRETPASTERRQLCPQCVSVSMVKWVCGVVKEVRRRVVLYALSNGMAARIPV